MLGLTRIQCARPKVIIAVFRYSIAACAASSGNA
jgi:hypothetical protein